MDEESPNPSAKETFEQLELRRRKAEVELYEGYVREQVQHMENENQFQGAYQRERLRQAQRYSNIAVILMPSRKLCNGKVGTEHLQS
jgi:hypothetical protein